MNGFGNRGWLWIALAVGMAWPATAEAQLMRGPQGPFGPGARAPQVSPLIAYNPEFNPYWNQGGAPIDRTTGALLMMSVVSSQSGLGSGQLSGVRGQGTPPAEMPRSLARPGGSAGARFFERGLRADHGAGRYYNRQGQRFMHNGR